MFDEIIEEFREKQEIIIPLTDPDCIVTALLFERLC